MNTYPAGTVAVATVGGVEGVRVVRRGRAIGGGWWFNPDPDSHPISDDDLISNIRPLIVLDLGLDAVSSAQVGSDVSGAAYVVRALRDSAGAGYDRTLNAIADQIEAQTRPPRIPEPGLWGVVEARVDGIPRRRWVHHEEDHWVADTGERRYWDDLIDPVLVREGVDR